MRTCLCCLLVSVGAIAQVDTGTITGVVSDASGSVIPAALVIVTQDDTNVETRLSTNAAGFYAAPALRPGRYHITVSKDGFRPRRQTGIELRVQDRLEVNFDLEVGAVNAEVTVTASAPLLESETSSLGQVIEEKTITDLPLNGRNFIQLATLGAGTLPSTRTAERDNFISNGARAVQNSYLLDGTDNKNRIMGFDSSSAQIISPVIDSIQEFKVQTATFSAEFGQAAGGVVNVTLKSGGNGIHGSLFEFLRNSVLDATPFFQPGLGGKPAFIQNQFGATIGGPIVRNRLFYFGSWQSTREVNAAPQVGTVPLAAALAGNFAPTPIYDPATTRPNPNGAGFVRDLFPGNRVPISRWDPVSTKLLALYPAPNLPGAVRNFFYNPKERVNNDQYNARVDYHVGARDNLFGRVSSSTANNVLPPGLPSDLIYVYPDAKNIAFSETHTFSNNKVNELRFAYVRTHINQDIQAQRLFEEYGIKGTLNDPRITGLPIFAVTSLSSIGTTGPGSRPIAATGSGNAPSEKSGNIFQFLDNLSWIVSRHTLKFGIDLQQVTLNVYATNAARPTFSFNGVYTQNPLSRAKTGAAFADFLLGLVNNTTASTQQLDEIQQRIAQGYIQDDWKVTNKLTLNIGLRYELPFPWVETSDHQSNLFFEKGPLYLKIIDASKRGNSGLPRGLVGTDYNNFAPRVGFAYQAAKRTVVRSGFGVFYGRDENIGINRRLPNNPPYQVTTLFQSDQLTPNIVLSQGFPPNSLDPNLTPNPSFNAIPYAAPLPYVLQWNFNIEQQLPGDFVTQVSYTGSGAHKLYFVNNINLPPPGAGNVDARRPFQGYGSIFYYAPLINSTYNALLGKLERRFSKGLSLLASYTYGHSLDGGRSNNDNNDPGPQNARDLRSEHGNSNFDVRHRFVASGVYELPFRNNPIARGWQMSGIFSVQTGQPFTVTLNTDPTNTGGSPRPNRLRDGSLPDPTPDRWFDVEAFEQQNTPVFGNSGRGILRGPGHTNIDLSLARNFAIRERVRLQFRAEGFNIANHPQFGIPNAVIGAAGVGIIGGVVTSERQIQLALKLAF